MCDAKHWLEGYIPMGIRAEAFREEAEANYYGSFRKQEAAQLLLANAAQIDRERETIRNAISGIVDSVARAVLWLRYIDGLQWPEICEKIGYETTQTYKYHRRGLGEIENNYS